MAAGDLSIRDITRLSKCLKIARERTEGIPPIKELVPELKKALDADGAMLENLVVVFGEPIREAFNVLRNVVAEKYGDEYAAALWNRVTSEGP